MPDGPPRQRRDFGIVPVEANAAGKPVVAFGGGGALETLVTASRLFFHGSTVEAVLGALRRADALPTTPEQTAAAGQRFSHLAFETHLPAAIERVDRPPPRHRRDG